MLSENDASGINKNNGSRLISGVMLLTASTLICKIIGLLFKIPIINIVGIDGMAYFSSAYNIYMLLNSIAAAGLPIALSILVSRNRVCGRITNLNKIFRVALSVFLILGITGAACLYFGADLYSSAIGIELSSLSVKAIAPTLLFICISGAFRGYFQGYEIMAPTAISQLIESLGKLLLGVGFAMYCAGKGMDSSKTAAAAVFGLSVGVLISSLFLILRFWIHLKNGRKRTTCLIDNETQKSTRIFYELMAIAFPITLSSCITSLTSLADTALITNRLVYSGYSSDVAIGLYSSYTNLAIPLFNLPPALITSIGISIIPALSRAITIGALEDSKRSFSSALRLCCMLAIPSAAGIAIFAKPILLLLYPSEAEACNFAAPLLSVLSAAIVFSCLITVCNATLQAYMKQFLPIVSMAAGATVKVVVEYILVGTDVGIWGAPISTLCCTFTIFLLDIIFITVYTPQRFDLAPLCRTALATIFSVGISACAYNLAMRYESGSALSLFIAIFLSLVLFAVSAIIFGAVTYSDLACVKALRPFAEFLKNNKLIRVKEYKNERKQNDRV